MSVLPRDPDIQIERTPPQNIELEMCVLGGIMLEPDHGYRVASDYLHPDSFYLDGHGIIFELMGELHAQGTPPDQRMVLDALRSRNLLEKVGGAGVLLSMINSVASSASVEYHAKKIADKAHLRALIRAATQIIEECYRQQLPLPEILDQAESAVLQLSRDSNQQGMELLRDSLVQYWEELGKRDEELARIRESGDKRTRLPVMGLPTRCIDLDKILGGLKAQELSIVAARPSMGKTAFALNVARNLAVWHGCPVGIVSLEMGKKQLDERFLSLCSLYTCRQTRRIAGLSTERLWEPEMTDLEWKVLTDGYNQLLTAPIYIYDRGNITTAQLKSMAREAKAKHNIQLLIVDYLTLVTGKGDNRTQEVGNISRTLKAIAKELGIHVMAMSQLSRKPADRNDPRPRLSDLRDSGEIEQDADVVMFLHRDEYYKTRKSGKAQKRERQKAGQTYDKTLPGVEINVAKNRNGQTGLVTMVWFAPIMAFLDAADWGIQIQELDTGQKALPPGNGSDGRYDRGNYD